MKLRTRTPQSAATRLRYAKFRFRMYLLTTSLLIVFFLYLCATALINNHYRNDPGTQTISATVTNTQKDCIKSGCYYDSFGNYSIYGKQEQSVKVAWLTQEPVTGQVTVLVNPNRPHVAMPYYYNPYPHQAMFEGGFAGAFIIWTSLLYFWYRRSQQKLAAKISTTNS